MVSIHQIAPYIGEDGSRSVQPEVPLNLRVTRTTISSIRWDWDAVSDADGYKLEYRLGQTGEWMTAIPNIPTPSYPVGGLIPNSAYYARVRSVIGSVYSAWSEIDMAATLLPVPGNIDNLRVHSTGSNNVEWRWDSEPYASSYDWEFRPYNQGSLLSSGNTNSVFYQRLGLDVGRRYQLRVRAKNASGTGPWSSWRSGDTRIAAPTGFTLSQSNVNAGSIALSWDSVEHASGYVVRGSTTQLDGENFGVQTTGTSISRSIVGSVRCV